ncbi:head-tail adaptor protein [Aliiruegeria sabulilitoris]|uniref:head-tail adaptor protein n=1 Tax=Aliiruegeria sabulilitoris TaxID=1510458 RepID=UPI0008379ED4|nr:head-tail adaptor protein [Aliiruegeria sabulilitoris]NDR56066.1 head-tail adaptor protein [Pseudoruegeria sp. M32A2M]
MTGRLPNLSRRLTLETLERVPDGSGGYDESWIELGTLWAEVKAGTGKETASDYLTLSYVPYRITVRAAPPGDSRRPRSDQRFREGDRIFRILAVADAETDGRYLICYAREEEASA